MSEQAATQTTRELPFEKTRNIVISVNVSDLDRSIAWWGEMLGFEPTYVMKEKAPDRTVRTISLSGPEVFSSARTADPEPQAAPVVPEPAPAPVEEPEIRRAVGD